MGLVYRALSFGHPKQVIVGSIKSIRPWNTVTDGTFGRNYLLITFATRLPISRLPLIDGWIISAP